MTRITPITVRLSALFEELRTLPKPTDEYRRLGREGAETTAAALYLLDTADDATPNTIKPIVARWKLDVDRWAQILGERDRAICIVREMMALVSGDMPPPSSMVAPHAFVTSSATIAGLPGTADDTSEDQLDEEAEVALVGSGNSIASGNRPAIVCEFPGDIRPLLRTDLRRVSGATAELRHTNDWLLAEVVNVFLKQIRRMNAAEAWAVYAILAEKLQFTPDEAAQRAGSFSAPTVAALARHYSGRPSDRFKFVPGELIAAQILAHLHLSTLEISGARLYSRQEASGTELNAVAECLLFGSGDMRDFRRSLGGKQCRKCNDFFYPGELICHECGAVDWSTPVRATVIAILILLTPVGWTIWMSTVVGEFHPSFMFWAGLVVGGLFGIRALRKWKRIYDYYYKPISF